MQGFIIQFHSVNDYLFVVLYLPTGATNGIATGQSRENEFSFSEFDLPILIVRNEFYSLEDLLNILQSEEIEIPTLLPLNEILIHG